MKNRIKIQLLVSFLVLNSYSFSQYYGMDQCTGGISSASSTYSALFSATSAFDDNTGVDNCWATANGVTSAWLQYDFGSGNEKTIKKYTITARNRSTGHLTAPRDWTFEGSNDAMSWNILDSQAGETGWNSNGLSYNPPERRDYPITNSTAYRYYRINISANNGSTLITIGEVQMMEEVIYTAVSANEGSVWYFGYNAGIDFGYDPPMILDNSSMSQWEGCASISDVAGNCLFYTNGITVWDSTHAVMQNGTGLNGHQQCTQSGVIIPNPLLSNIYYIFTVTLNAGADGLQYSVVDMNLNGGLGAVTAQKNILLNTPNTEKITAVRHANGMDTWVVTHDWGNNKFLAYLVTSAGVNPTPVESDAGYVHTGGFSNWNAAGYMKVSPDGTKLAANVLDDGITQVLDFNNATGIVSNPITLTPSGSLRPRAYGLEFSPDGSKLYTTAWTYNDIWQYDLQAGTETDIQNSVQIIGTSIWDLGALQVAPNGKIYVCRNKDHTDDGDNPEYLGVINNPNTVGLACAYIDEGIYIGPEQSGIGLPTFIQSFFETPLPVELICFNASVLEGEVQLEWSTTSEKNNDYFEIQHSTDAINYSPLSKLKGNGNTNQLVKYSFRHRNPKIGANYYRLKQVDYDGGFEYSKVNVIRVGDIENQIIIYPNPARDYFNISLEQEYQSGLVLNIYNTLGKKIEEQQLGSEKNQRINIQWMSEGLYSVVIKYQGVLLYSQLIVVCR